MKVFSILIWLLFWAALLFSQPASQASQAFRQAVNFSNQKDYGAAILCYTQAIELDKYKSYFYYNRGLAYEANGQHAKAIADFIKSNDLKPTGEAYYQIGLIAYHKNETAKAREAFESGRMLKTNLDNLNFYLGMIYFKDKKYEQAEQCFTDFTNNNKTNPEAFYYKAYSQAKQGRNAEAAESLKFASVYQSTDYRYYLRMYDVYMAMNDLPNALNNISMVIELGQRKPEYYEQRAALYHATGNDFKSHEDQQFAKNTKGAMASAEK